MIALTLCLRVICLHSPDWIDLPVLEKLYMGYRAFTFMDCDDSTLIMRSIEMHVSLSTDLPKLDALVAFPRKENGKEENNSSFAFPRTIVLESDSSLVPCENQIYLHSVLWLLPMLSAGLRKRLPIVQPSFLLSRLDISRPLRRILRSGRETQLILSFLDCCPCCPKDEDEPAGLTVSSTQSFIQDSLSNTPIPHSHRTPKHESPSLHHTSPKSAPFRLQNSRQNRECTHFLETLEWQDSFFPPVFTHKEELECPLLRICPKTNRVASGTPFLTNR